MDEPERPATTDPEVEAEPELAVDLPPGSHPLEVAARRGIGPLSPRGREVWHGHARPCVSCGQLVLHDAAECDECGQDLSQEMLEKMRAHAGPWYVLEHVRPFPGVSLERIVRQIRRGLITETSIVRGPSTDYQWRYAIETPGLCRYFERCWQCHEKVSPADTYCRSCLSYLSFERPQTPAVAPAPTPDVAPPAAVGPEPTVVGQPVAEPAGVGQPVGEPEGRGSPTEILSNIVRSADEAGPIAVAAPDPPDRTARPEPAPAPADELRELSALVGKAELPSHDTIWDEPPRIGGVRATWVVAAVLIVVIVGLLLLTESRGDSLLPLLPVVPSAILTMS